MDVLKSMESKLMCDSINRRAQYGKHFVYDTEHEFLGRRIFIEKNKLNEYHSVSGGVSKKFIVNMTIEAFEYGFVSKVSKKFSSGNVIESKKIMRETDDFLNHIAKTKELYENTIGFRFYDADPIDIVFDLIPDEIFETTLEWLVKEYSKTE